MLSEREIQAITERFVRWLDEEEFIGCEISDIVRTADTVQAFVDACREYRTIRRESCEGKPVTIIEASQRARGEERRDVYILDADDGVRLVYA